MQTTIAVIGKASPAMFLKTSSLMPAVTASPNEAKRSSSPDVRARWRAMAAACLKQAIEIEEESGKPEPVCKHTSAKRGG